MKINIFLIFALVFLISCTAQGPEKPYLTFNGQHVTVEVADTMENWTKGLMGRTSLPENHGMLFVFPTAEEKTFWMKDTNLPLDIIFFNEHYEIVDIKENFQPCTQEQCELYTAKAKVNAALEINAGFVQKHALKVGDKANYMG